SPPAVSGLPATALGAFDMIGRTLSIYFAGRFARTVIAVFLFVFFLIYCRCCGNAPPVRRRAEGDRFAHGVVVVPSDADCRGAGAPIRRTIRRDDHLPQSVPENGAR